MSANEGEKQVQGQDSSGEEVQACLMGGSWTESRKGSPEDCLPPQQYGHGWQNYHQLLGAPAHPLAAPAVPNYLRGHAQRFGAWNQGYGENWSHGTEHGQGYGRGYGYGYGGYAPGACAVEGGRRVGVEDCNFELAATPASTKTWMN